MTSAPLQRLISYLSSVPDETGIKSTARVRTARVRTARVESTVSAEATVSSRWATPVAFGLAIAGVLVLAFALISWTGASAAGSAYDFHAYYDAALRLISTGTPYQAETLRGPFSPGPYGLYLYAPPLAILFVPLTWLGDQAAMLAWLALRIALLVATCALLPVSRPIRLASFGIAALSAPFLLDLNLGNVSLIVTFLAVVAWRWLDRPASAVAVAASLALRPTMAVVVGWWLLRGKLRPIVWTVLAGSLIFLLTLPFVGIDGWFDYLTVIRNLSNVTGVPKSFDLGSAVLLLGGPAWLSTLALFAGYATAVVATLFSLRRDRELSYVVTVMSSLLLAPLMWDHYLTLLLVPAAFLAGRGRIWALSLPLLAWVPVLVGGALYPVLALAGLLLPFLARSAGEPAGTFLDLLPGRLPGRRVEKGDGSVPAAVSESARA